MGGDDGWEALLAAADRFRHDYGTLEVAMRVQRFRLAHGFVPNEALTWARRVEIPASAEGDRRALIEVANRLGSAVRAGELVAVARLVAAVSVGVVRVDESRIRMARALHKSGPKRKSLDPQYILCALSKRERESPGQTKLAYLEWVALDRGVSVSTVERRLRGSGLAWNPGGIRRVGDEAS